jgi:hypothetical protein
MPIDPPSAALIEISCPEPLYPALRKIENLSVFDRPLRLGGGMFSISALAKPDAIKAAEQLGCGIQIVKTAEEYEAIQKAAYDSIDRSDTEDRK